MIVHTNSPIPSVILGAWPSPAQPLNLAGGHASVSDGIGVQRALTLSRWQRILLTESTGIGPSGHGARILGGGEQLSQLQ